MSAIPKGHTIEEGIMGPSEQKLATLGRQCRDAAPGLFALSLTETRAALRLLRELAKGEPLARAALPLVLGVSASEAEVLLTESHLTPTVYWDEERRVAGFWGLSTIRTRHQLAIKGRTLWSWCAQDSLFLPELIGETGEIESQDPESSERIRLTVSPERVERVEPPSVAVSMVRPDTVDLTSVARIISTACHYVYFFASKASGDRWVARHPHTTLLSLDEAFACAKRQNAWLLEASREPAGKELP